MLSINSTIAFALAFLELCSAQTAIGFGPYFSLGPVSTSSWIRESTTTLVLPAIPSPRADRLALWPGSQLGGKQVPANPGDHLTMHYKYNDLTGNYDQTVAINGVVVSTLSTNDGHAQGWGTAVECQEKACKSNVPAHRYLATTIILDSADPAFGKTLAINEATSSGLTTKDGGKTWAVSTIDIGSHTFNL
ncbi:hypothetical protein N7539_004692 [Penicillium diatomitis]|uniref:Uncharacterized protein n=1 Tax=Penicillium diatomitis TaxID=2819901 RepID=A0A9W9X5F6_9EURO|nr:uncharacterized protein N7539_004692 [Penicillium diatomitis]KAJ5484704.1 hypothetical protein N7539_004692 [Penicillium diatomitis]